MTRYNRTKEKRTGPRPAHIYLGVDIEGGSHVYHIRTESAHTIEDAAIAYHEPLDGHSTTVYMEYVADRRGWHTRYFYRTITDALHESIDFVVTY